MIEPTASAIDRRQLLCSGFLAASALAASRPASVWAQDDGQEDGTLVTPAAESAIEKGLSYLSDLQNDDGTFGHTDFARNVGVCSLAGMSFLAAGSTPDRGKFGRNTRRCVDYAHANARADGLIRTEGAVDRRPMYGHGFATTLLCLTHGTTTGARANRSKISAAVKTILDSQNEAGGWRYEPRRADADISVTACQMTALRAAKNAGFYVPQIAMQKAAEFVKSCQNRDGGFAYQPNEGDSELARSAAAIVSLFGAGIYDGPHVENCLAYLHRESERRGTEKHEYFFYGLFYSAQAMWQSGAEHWRRWFPSVRDKLIDLQKENGSWIDPIGPAYATAVALVALQMENGYVPLFQK